MISISMYCTEVFIDEIIEKLNYKKKGLDNIHLRKNCLSWAWYGIVFRAS
jgi:hypothetical protein